MVLPRCLLGQVTDTKLLDEKSASYLAVFFPTENSWTLLFAELLTGHLFITILAQKTQTLLDAELARFMPDEILVPLTKLGEHYGQLFQSQGYVVSYESYSMRVLKASLLCQLMNGLQNNFLKVV